jgi:NAD(P)-dependent dehydrogenase (short-subunit alcohol dehydrogenase family)
MKRFEGKTALVTGRNSGIGLATAVAFASEGARLVITGRDQSTLDRAQAQLGDDAIAIRNDAGRITDGVALAELLGRGIRVNVVSPGPIRTALYGRLGISADELSQVAAKIQDQIPLKRFGRPEEIAGAVLYLSSAESAFVVGTELVIDGGMSQL